jgi:hypothetical protein
MEMTGNLRKMETDQQEVVRYRLPIGEHRVDMNELIGRKVILEYLGKIHCVRCGRETRKSFAQGYCYPCFISAPETEECVLRPELCRAHEGIARDMAYAKEHCLIEHVVYLAVTSGLKVGVTRYKQIPTRWIDQGAIRAIELARTPNRFTAGLIEVAMKAHILDKTNWRRMLTDETFSDIDLAGQKEVMARHFPQELIPYISPDNHILELKYPVLRYPVKVKSINLDTDPLISEVLVGIRGQYLMFEDDRVINIRKFGGYQVRFQVPG